MSRRVPGPARVVKDGARQRDEVRVPGADDRFGLIEIRDEPDRDHRQAGRRFDGAREGHLVTRPQRDLLCGCQTAARHMKSAAAVRLQRLRERNRLVDVPTLPAPSPFLIPAATPDARVETRHARHRRPPAESATGFRGCRRTRPDGDSTTATGTRGAGTRVRDAVAPRRCQVERPRLAAKAFRISRRDRCDRARRVDLRVRERDRGRCDGLPSAGSSGRGSGACLPMEPVNDALRPACASRTAIGMSDQRRTTSSVRASAASVSSDHNPRSRGIRPSGSTARGFIVSSAAPDNARRPNG